MSRTISDNSIAGGQGRKELRDVWQEGREQRMQVEKAKLDLEKKRLDIERVKEVNEEKHRRIKSLAALMSTGLTKEEAKMLLDEML